MYYKINIHYKGRNWFVRKEDINYYNHKNTLIILHYFFKALILIEFDLILQLFLLIFRLMYLKLSFLIKLFN